jgi:NAD+ diphosphatase
MKTAEQVTFGGSSLDRAGEVRANPQVIKLMMRAADTRAIVFWRGKPLIHKSRPATLMRVPLDHPILADAAEDMILLGREDGAAVFAYDISSWEPAELDTLALGGFLDPSEQLTIRCLLNYDER